MYPDADVKSNKLVVHLPTASLPWVTGGREVFSLSLAQELKKIGWNNLVVYHQNASVREPLGCHEYEGIGIQVLPPLTPPKRTEIYSCRTLEAPGFQELMQRVHPALVHFHDFSVGASLLHLDEARAIGARTVMTYHSPGQSCLQRELLFNGTTVCDGEIRLDRCTACRLGVQGVPGWLKNALSMLSLPEFADNRLARALSARTMTGIFTKAFAEMTQKIDRIHAHAQWVVDLLRLNRVPEKKLRFFGSGLPYQSPAVKRGKERQSDSSLRIVMLGRCDPIKGQEVLIDAVQSLPISAKVQVAFYGSYWDSSEYGRRCLQKINGDTRFLAPKQVPYQEIPNLLSHSDIMVVPSLWLETGPLVVLEAFAARLPVVGSRLGGIAELVKDNTTGLLFAAGNKAELHHCLSRLLNEKGLIEGLSNNILPPRTMREVAVDMSQLYNDLLTKVDTLIP